MYLICTLFLLKCTLFRCKLFKTAETRIRTKRIVIAFIKLCEKRLQKNVILQVPSLRPKIMPCVWLNKAFRKAFLFAMMPKWDLFWDLQGSQVLSERCFPSSGDSFFCVFPLSSRPRAAVIFSVNSELCLASASLITCKYVDCVVVMEL